MVVDGKPSRSPSKVIGAAVGPISIQIDRCIKRSIRSLDKRTSNELRHGPMMLHSIPHHSDAEYAILILVGFENSPSVIVSDIPMRRYAIAWKIQNGCPFFQCQLFSNFGKPTLGDAAGREVNVRHARGDVDVSEVMPPIVTPAAPVEAAVNPDPLQSLSDGAAALRRGSDRHRKLTACPCSALAADRLDGGSEAPVDRTSVLRQVRRCDGDRRLVCGCWGSVDRGDSDSQRKGADHPRPL